MIWLMRKLIPLVVACCSSAAMADLAETGFIASLNNGISPTPGTNLSNPFPSGIVQPVNAYLGPLTSFALPGGSDANIAAFTVGMPASSSTVFGHRACAEARSLPYHFR